MKNLKTNHEAMHMLSDRDALYKLVAYLKCQKSQVKGIYEKLQ